MDRSVGPERCLPNTVARKTVGVQAAPGRLQVLGTLVVLLETWGPPIEGEANAKQSKQNAKQAKSKAKQAKCKAKQAYSSFDISEKQKYRKRIDTKIWSVEP